VRLRLRESEAPDIAIGRIKTPVGGSAHP
jgi:hypothetical protein